MNIAGFIATGIVDAVDFILPEAESGYCLKQSLSLCYECTYFHLVAFFYDGFCGCADMLPQRNDYLFGRRKDLYGALCRKLIIVRGEYHLCEMFLP